MKQLKYATLIMVASAIVAGAQAQKPGSLPPGLDKYIEQVLQTFHVPGMAVSVVQNGKVLLAKGYGVKKMAEQAPVDEHTLFLIASNTKAFTATALAILIDEGKIKWDDRVTDHLPWFRMSDDYVTTHITIRDLLVHHSGLPAYGGDIMLFPPSDYSRREILDKLRNIPLTHDFRTTYAYDNILYLAAGEVIAAASGMSWEDFIRTRIFDKVGMQESISRFSELKNKTNVAIAHARHDGEIKAVDHFRDDDVGDAGDPAGGICSSASDMANWLITQLDSGTTPSRQQLFNAAETGQLWKIVTPMPDSKYSADLQPLLSSSWGYCLGFRTYNYGKHTIICHGGALKGFVSQIAMVPQLNLGISVLTNQSSSGAYWSVIYHLLDYYMRNPSFDWVGGYKKQLDTALAMYRRSPGKLLIKKDSVGQMPMPLDKYTGLYTHELMGNVSIRKEPSGLVMSFDHSRHYTADLEYFQYNTFIASFRHMDFKAQAYLSFSFDYAGKVDEVKLKTVDPDGVLDFDDLVLKPMNEKIADTTALRKIITAAFARHPEGTFAVAVKDLSNGQTFFINEQDHFHAASTMKTPVLIETFRQAATGKFHLSDSMVVKNSFQSIYDGSTYKLDTLQDSEKDLYAHVGEKLPIYNILFRMITKSSNLSTNNIIDLVGAKNVMATLKTIGANSIQVLRGVEDNQAFTHDMNNTVTARDLMLVFEQLANGTIVSKNACDSMISILKAQYFRDVIPARLPPGIITATKSGSIAGICHDSGIVYLPDGRKYVVVLLSRGIEDLQEATDMLANASRYIYNYIN